MTTSAGRTAPLALAGLLALVAPTPATAQVGATGVTTHGAGAAVQVGASAAAATGAARSKKDVYLADKAAEQAAAKARRPSTAPARPGKRPTPVVSVFNTWTHEYLVLDRDDQSPLPPRALVDRFLRCHFTNQATDMRPELIATLRDAARHFDARRIEIVSGYRSPKYNLMLRKKGHEVAKDSQHTRGYAVDFRIPGVDVRTLDQWALDRKKGGVGLYRESQFVHVDVGPVRRWNGT